MLEGCNFVVKQVPCIDGIVQGVVQVVRNQLVVFYQSMVGFGREKQWREIQGVNGVGSIYPGFRKCSSYILKVVVYDVMPADELCPMEKPNEFGNRRFVEGTPITLDTANVKNFTAFGFNLDIDAIAFTCGFSGSMFCYLN